MIKKSRKKYIFSSAESLLDQPPSPWLNVLQLRFVPLICKIPDLKIVAGMEQPVET
jgi:hypothetical protein